MADAISLSFAAIFSGNKSLLLLVTFLPKRELLELSASINTLTRSVMGNAPLSLSNTSGVTFSSIVAITASF